MAQIFTHAHHTRVWLGPDFEGSDEIMDLIFRLGERYPNGIYRAIEDWKPEILSHQRALTRMVKNPYWTRLWVLQEILLGRNVLVFQGTKSVPWMPHFKNVLTEIFPDIRTSRGECVLGGWPSIIVTSWVYEPGLVGIDWIRAGYFAGELHCHDVRDNVFSLLGLVHPSERFHPDYSLDCQDSLLLIMRKALASLETRARGLGTDYHIVYARRAMDFALELARRWYVVFHSHGQRLDMRIVRHFLRQEAHPRIFFRPVSTNLAFMTEKERYYPDVVVRALLKWRLANQGSWRWKHPILLHPWERESFADLC